MKVNCERCNLEGIRFKKGFKMSPIVHRWLCDSCFDLCAVKFCEFQVDFLQPERSKREDHYNNEKEMRLE